MQQNDSTFKYVQSWNNQSVDTYHDIIISLDYALYNYNDEPTCGFCVALFESLNEKPRGGGPAYSLCYTPNGINDLCNPEGYEGLEAAICGVGFDINGIFAKKTEYVDGVDYTVKNSIAIRDSIENNYALLKQTDNLLYPYNFSLAQQLTASDQKIEYKQIRIIFTNSMSKMQVEVKREEDREFTKILDLDMPILEKRTAKVALFYTSLDQNSKFLLKQFNVAGFPDRFEPKYLTTCFQEISTKSNLLGNKLPAYNDWIISTGEKAFNLYKFDGNEYNFKNTVRSSSELKVLNYHKNLVFAKSGNSLVVYEYRGNRFIRRNTLNLPTLDDITSCAAYDDTLVISSSSINSEGVGEYYYVYDYIKDSSIVESIGTWRFYQSFNTNTFNVTGLSGFGKNVELYKEYLLSRSTNDYIASYRRDPDYGFLYHQTLTKPYDNVRGFGESMSIDNYEALIGAPWGNKRVIRDAGQGEVFHYVLSPVSKQWVLVSELGQFFNINSPAGNFGYSVKLDRNTAVIGSPSEQFYRIADPTIELPNYGRVYVMRKGDYGYFTQKTEIYPLTSDQRSYKFFGSQVNTFQNQAIVSMPFTLDKRDGYIDIFNLDCLLPTPPEHLTIPISAIQLLDETGFVIDKLFEDYIVKIQIPEVEILYTPPLSAYVYWNIPLRVSLSGFNRNIAPVSSWAWNMTGGGSYDYYNTQTITHDYSASGNYIVRLSGINSYGTGIATLSVFAIEPLPAPYVYIWFNSVYYPSVVYCV